MSILDKFKLDGKRALVTGCSRGIGEAMAIALAEAGADIIGVSSSMESSGEDVGRKVTQLGRAFSAYNCDFKNRTSLYGFIEQLKTDIGIPDILVNNAGVVNRAPIEQHTDEQWDEVIAVNQTAQFILTRELGKGMLARGTGKIVFVASLLTYQGGITVSSYAASKGAIGQMTKAFANEWASSGLNVNAIAPGYIHTDMTADLKMHTARATSITSRIPVGRWGSPADFAGPVVFLCSEAASYMNGSILLVDGGWMGR